MENIKNNIFKVLTGHNFQLLDMKDLNFAAFNVLLGSKKLFFFGNRK